jgi:group II intron reverse transcriptase/maturase
MTTQGNGDGTPMPESLSMKLHRISEMAQEVPELKFRTLAHLINEEMLLKSYHELRRDAAAGIDGVTAHDYEQNLQENLKNLHQRLKERRYRAQPLRRVYIDKEDGRQRALSIPVLEDKIVQKATITILSQIYERDFLPSSFGYRPRLNAHDAVRVLQKKIIFEKVSFVLEADIQDYFGSMVRQKLMEMLRQRVMDKDVLRLIGKWLHVGVIEDGRLLTSEDGTYQGSVISPLLANIYLHYVLDVWIEHTIKPRLRGHIALVRYADDFVLCFQYRSDAEAVRQMLSQRFADFGLRLHPEKTRLLHFGRFEREDSRKEKRKPNTFDFLGFTFFCTEDREGRFTVKSKTRSKRLRRGLLAVAQWCRHNRHEPVKEQARHLAAVLRGHYNYYGLRANYPSLKQFYRGTLRLWMKWLSQRSQRGRITWRKFHRILKTYPLPRPFITQPTGPAQLELFETLA